MNVDRRWLGTSVVRVRVLVAALVLLAAGCMVLGWGSRSRQTAAAQTPSARALSAQNQAEIPALAQSWSGEAMPGEATPGAQIQARSLFAGLPLMFEPNLGQANLDPADPRVRFVARGSGYSLALGSEGAVLSLSSRSLSSRTSSKPAAVRTATRVESLRMKLAGSNPNASLTATDPLRSKSNYFLGNDPAKWRHDVPQFARVRYENIYPGINLVFYGNQGRLEYDFQVAPGSDPAQAELEFDGANVELKDGSLVMKGEGGSVRLDAPRVYQEIAGRQQPVEGSFVLRAANRVGFAIGPYDHTRELVIDPILSYSTYFGGTGDELSTSVAVDSEGDIYLAGSTTSPNLPAVGVYQTALAGPQNVYIAKINPGSGANGLIYVTYLGGDGTDSPVGIKVDAAGDPVVAGTTSSTNFPTTPTAYQNAPEPGSAGTKHVFVTELNNVNNLATALVYSTYLSGNGDDLASGMTIDATGYAYVTGTTTSSDVSSTTTQFPASTVPQALPYQTSPRGPIQFFVTKVNTNAPKTGSIAYSTYFGGGNFTTAPIAVGGGITVDTNGNVYFTGTTNYSYTGCQGCQTTDFPILNAYQPCLNQAAPVVIVSPQLCPTGSTAASDAFVAKLNPNGAQGQQLLWSTYFGGTATDSGTGIALDAGAAHVYITGTTNSPDATATTTFGQYQPCLDNVFDPTTKLCTPPTNPANDAFVAQFSNPATITVGTNVSLTYFSYLGGVDNEAGLAITVDVAGGALMTGWTESPNTGTGSGDFPVFPNPNTIQSQLSGPRDAFMARLNSVAVVGQPTTGSWANYLGGSGMDEGTGITVDSNQTIYVAGDTNSNNLPVSKPLETYNGGYDAFVTQLGTAASLSIEGVLTLGTNQTYISAGNQATFTYTLTNGGPDLAYNITVTDNVSPTITQVPVAVFSLSTSAGTCSGTGTGASSVSCTIPALQAGSTAIVTIVLIPTANSTGNAATFNGGAVVVTGPNNTTLATTSVSAQMSDYSMQVGPNSVTVQSAGGTATYQVQIFPHPVYGPPAVSMSVSGLPPGTTSNFTTNPVTLVGTSPASTTLNITTTARPIVTPASILTARQFYAIWLSVPGLTLLGFGVGSDRRRRRIAGALVLGLVFAMLLLQPACSKGTTQTPPSGTPAGTYPLTVTATAGSDSKSYNINLVVP